jgi:hypothetical protein
MELRYILNGYGISTDTIPISWTGTVKASNSNNFARILVVSAIIFFVP